MITKNFHAHEQLRKTLRHGISKLEQHLLHFPSDALHLQVALEKHPRIERFVAALVLRVPSNTLSSKKHATDPVTAVNGAVRTLLRELSSLKAELRHQASWHREARRASAGVA